MVFDLGLQDLDEGIVRWEYGRPYRIRQADGMCAHRGPNGCTVYEHRPAVCRSYDCRKDRRVWLDYEQLIPNPEIDKIGTPVEAPPVAPITGSQG